MKILMVCLGNICRSPLAEGILRDKALKKQLNIKVDSAGTSGYHVGESPDPRMIQTAGEFGIDISYLRARKFQRADFKEFDRIYVMDESNYEDVISLAVNDEERQKVDYLLNASYKGQNLSVPDPYFGGQEGFYKVYKLVEEACEAIVQEVEKELQSMS
ncbi:MAG: low molecular weight phosphotyrosine protein phosphatase [Bacteroidetes bacterium]|nr:MAG: low molecular weight phosphotyrosine protein phosphatase [Bacteroidota bacterium]